MAKVIFITHPEVVIDPATPVPMWPLSTLGRQRTEGFARRVGGAFQTVWSSTERKAIDGAEILANHLGVERRVDPELGENDRSSTGYLEPAEFWPVVQDFFAHPDESIRGWEPASAAQRRIVSAIERVALHAELAGGHALVVSHGGVGRLLMAHLQGAPIGGEQRPSNPGGGCCFALRGPPLTLESGWCDIDDWR